LAVIILQGRIQHYSPIIGDQFISQFQLELSIQS